MAVGKNTGIPVKKEESSGVKIPVSYTHLDVYKRQMYTFKITDPLAFYAHVAGNVEQRYTKAQLMEQCDMEFVNALDTALSMCSDEGFQYNELPKKRRV